MDTRLAKVIRFSALVATAGALSFAVFFSNCGGSSGVRTGNAGATGSAGSGAGGTTGGGGTNGTAGVTGSGGTGGVVRNVCTPKPDLMCGASAIMLADGHVTDFSPVEWNGPNGKYCNTSGLQGSLFAYQAPAVDGGVLSTGASKVETDTYKLMFTVGPGGYAGAGISFDGCVDVSSPFNALRFTATLTSGDLSNCVFKSQLQTFEQRPQTVSPAGGCDPDAGSCYQFPASPSLTSMITSATPVTITIPFASYTTNATQMSPAPGQLVGLQWQIESGPAATEGGVQSSCTVEIHIDDINFVTQ